MSSVEGHKVARLSVKFNQVMRSNRDFDLIWDKIEMSQVQLDSEQTILSRRKRPHSYEGVGEAEFLETPNVYTDGSILKC